MKGLPEVVVQRYQYTIYHVHFLFKINNIMANLELHPHQYSKCSACLADIFGTFPSAHSMLYKMWSLPVPTTSETLPR